MNIWICMYSSLAHIANAECKATRIFLTKIQTFIPKKKFLVNENK